MSIRQREKNYQKLREEVSKRVYLVAKQCTGGCGYTLPYPGYPHACYIGLASGYRPPRNGAMYMDRYIDQQMAQMVLQ